MSSMQITAAVHARTGVGLARRSLDVVASAVVLAATLPLIVVVAIAIKLSSRGPIIFRQRRVGEGYRLFTIYKFRTMRLHDGGAEYTTVHDARITRLGTVLRALHIDELPQLANVLRGDMTLVGPRPETPALALRYPVEQQPVLAYRPGMTGPCQVDMSIPAVDPDVDADDFYIEHLVPRRVVLDMAYLENPTMRRTVGVLLATVAVILRLRHPEG